MLATPAGVEGVGSGLEVVEAFRVPVLQRLGVKKEPGGLAGGGMLWGFDVVVGTTKTKGAIHCVRQTALGRYIFGGREGRGHKPLSR